MKKNEKGLLDQLPDIISTDISYFLYFGSWDANGDGVDDIQKPLNIKNNEK